MHSEDPHWLFTQYQQRSNILIIDCRTLNDYSKGHIEGSINLFIPPLMLRRLKKGNVPLKNFINSDVAKEKFENRGLCEKVVLYDEDSSSSSSLNDDGVLKILSKKLCEENSIIYLDGGFRRFEESFPHLCQCGEGTELNNAMFCLANLSISSNINEEIPSPMYDSNNNNTIKELPNVKDLLFRPDSSGPIEIVSRLYLGNKTDASTLKLLRRARITHILNVTPDLPNAFEEGKEFHYLRLPVQDNWGGDLVSHFPEAFDFIDQALEDGGNVLVHCLGGISRSSTIIIAYLMLKFDYSLNDAYDHVKSKKSNIAPNFNFMGQLLDLEGSRGKYIDCLSSLPGSISPGSMSTKSDISAASDDSTDSC